VQRRSWAGYEWSSVQQQSNRWVFKCFLNIVRLAALTTLSGRAFHTVGAAMEKARLPMTVRVQGTISLFALPERSERAGARGMSSHMYFFDVSLLEHTCPTRWWLQLLWNFTFTQRVSVLYCVYRLFIVMCSHAETSDYRWTRVAETRLGKVCV